MLVRTVPANANPSTVYVVVKALANEPLGTEITSTELHEQLGHNLHTISAVSSALYNLYTRGYFDKRRKEGSISNIYTLKKPLDVERYAWHSAPEDRDDGEVIIRRLPSANALQAQVDAEAAAQKQRRIEEGIARMNAARLAKKAEAKRLAEIEAFKAEEAAGIEAVRAEEAAEEARIEAELRAEQDAFDKRKREEQRQSEEPARAVMSLSAGPRNNLTNAITDRLLALAAEVEAMSIDLKLIPSKQLIEELDRRLALLEPDKQ